MKTMKLITEINNDIQLIVEQSDNKAETLYISGIYSSADLENNNNRKYPKNVLEREIGKIMLKVESKSLWGELGHPPNPEVNPDKIAILTESLEWKGSHVHGRSKVLDTPMGNILKTLVKEGRMGISSRGLGTVSESGNVNEDFNLITWDAVTDPSNNPSWVNGIYEGQEWGPISVKKEEPKITIEEARKEHFRKVWQVLTDIEKNLR